MQRENKIKRIPPDETYTNWNGSVLSALQISETNLHCESRPDVANLFLIRENISQRRSVIVKRCIKNEI